MPALRRELSQFEIREYLLITKFSWLMLASFATISLVACFTSNFIFAPTLIPSNLIVAFLALAVFVIYLKFRNDFFIIAISNAVATAALFCTVLPLFTYVATHYSRSFGLWDARLASIDASLYLDWPSFLNWTDTHPVIARVLSYAYGSYVPEAAVMIIFLSIIGEYCRLQMALFAFQISVAICTVVSIFMPALGQHAYRNIDTAFTYRWLTPIPSDVVKQLRTDMPVIPLDNLQGIITFPSCHAVLGVLLLWAFWKNPVVRWIALVVNGALVLATPIFGGHYFVDIAAGAFVAAGSILIARVMVKLAQPYVQDSRTRTYAATNINQVYGCVGAGKTPLEV
jgi:hypothetical protein